MGCAEDDIRSVADKERTHQPFLGGAEGSRQVQNHAANIRHRGRASGNLVRRRCRKVLGVVESPGEPPEAPVERHDIGATARNFGHVLEGALRGETQVAERMFQRSLCRRVSGDVHKHTTVSDEGGTNGFRSCPGVERTPGCAEARSTQQFS